MYAVIETGGKQYKVSPGDTIEIETLPDDPGEPVEFDRVLFYSDGDDIRCGAPSLENVRVVGTIVTHDLGKKIIVGKFRRHTGYRRKQGHRQHITRVAIDRIVAG